MIFDNISNWKMYKDIKGVGEILEYLSTLNENNFPFEKVRLDGDKIFINPVSLTTKPTSECIFEAHQKYIDVHFIISGTEGISTAKLSSVNLKGEFNKESDIAFYTGEADATHYLNHGDFMVCFPQDAHRVGMMDSFPTPVSKLVGKVLVK